MIKWKLKNYGVWWVEDEHGETVVTEMLKQAAIDNAQRVANSRGQQVTIVEADSSA